MSAVLDQPTQETTVVSGVKPRLITVAEYDRMIAAGIYTENDHLELLNGRIVEFMPKGAKHTSANSRIVRLLVRLLQDKAIVRSQDPIRLDELSAPEPDIVLANWEATDYAEQHPTPADILLVMEISDTTLGYDRDAKARAYARNGIRQYLLLNLQNETVEDYRAPAADSYGSKQTYCSGKQFNLVAFPEIEIKVDDLF